MATIARKALHGGVFNKFNNQATKFAFSESARIPRRPVPTHESSVAFGVNVSRKSLTKPTMAAQQRFYATSAAQSAILTIDQVDVSKVRFGQAVVVKGRPAKTVPVMYEFPDGRIGRLRIQTPKLRAPFGLSTFSGERDVQQVTLPVALDTDDQGAQKFKQLVQAFDAAVAQVAVNNMKDWFAATPGKEMLPEFVRFNCVSPIKLPKDPKYSPTVRLKVPFFQGEPAMRVFEGSEPSVSEALTPGARVVCILDAGPIWVLGNQYGMSFRIAQARIEPRPGFEPLIDYAFIDQAEEAEPDLEARV